MYQEKSNTLWKDMIGRYMVQNKYLHILNPFDKGANAPDNNIYLPVHICFTLILNSGGGHGWLKGCIG